MPDPAPTLPLPVLVLSDDRAGHYNLAEGIVAAVARRRPVVVSRLPARRGRWPGNVLAALTSNGAPPGAILRHVYGIDPAAIGNPRLVVSAGAETLAANVAAARIAGARNIFYGSLRRFRARDFSLALTSYADDVTTANQRMVIKPARFDPDTMTPPADPKLAALLIGGDAKGIRYALTDWAQLVVFLRRAHEELGTRWIIANSRRTSEAANEALARLTASGDGTVAAFADVRSGTAGGLEAVLAQAGAVVCTADSSSMLSECIWARRPVLAVSPAAYALEPREHGYRRFLTDRGWTRTLPIGLLEPATWSAAIAQIQPYAGNWQDDLALLLAHKLPDLFAPTPAS